MSRPHLNAPPRPSKKQVREARRFLEAADREGMRRARELRGRVEAAGGHGCAILELLPLEAAMSRPKIGPEIAFTLLMAAAVAKYGARLERASLCCFCGRRWGVAPPPDMVMLTTATSAHRTVRVGLVRGDCCEGGADAAHERMLKALPSLGFGDAETVALPQGGRA